MTNVLVDDSYLSDIADTIRSKLGVQDTYKPSEMADAIDEIGGGSTPTGTISITANGTYNVTDYASADVAVPGASLGTKSITENGTYTASSDSLDGYSSVTVNVSGGGGGNTYKSGTVTPTSRAESVTVDIGISDPSFIIIIPHDSTPLLSGGRTFVGGYYTKNKYYRSFLGMSNNAGTSLLAPTVDTSTMFVDMTGTTATMWVTRTTPTPTISAGYFEAIQYDWFAW